VADDLHRGDDDLEHLRHDVQGAGRDEIEDARVAVHESDHMAGVGEGGAGVGRGDEDRPPEA